MERVSFISIGGVGDVTKNMYLYESKDEILVVDCGFGFADETMPGVDLLIPDISYLQRTNKKIIGMILTHGHEDHIGALPFVLPKLSEFPIYASRLTAALANEKMKDFNIKRTVNSVNFGEEVTIGNFKVSFIRLTHSILDASNLFIKTPVGNFYHGSDYKFDFTPVDGNPSQLDKIAQAGTQGVLCLFSDCVGAERKGFTPSEMTLYQSFDEEFRKTKGKIFVTTYSSNISRLNQAIEIASKLNRKVVFMGRSLLKAREVGRSLGYMNYSSSMEIKPHEVDRYDPARVLILIAGSQAQEQSALVRVSTDNDKDIHIEKEDAVIFSADPIPGNENSINSLIDTISKKGAKVIYSDIRDDFHVSGHGSAGDIKLMISLTKPKYVFPIGGTYKQMVAFREIAKSMNFKTENVLLHESGQEIIFQQDGNVSSGRKINISNIFVDEITGEEVEHFVLVDRMKISKEGLVVVIVEVDTASGQLTKRPDILTRGFIYDKKDILSKRIESNLHKIFGAKRERVTNWVYYRKMLEKQTEQILFKEGREPLVIPVVLEV